MRRIRLGAVFLAVAFPTLAAAQQSEVQNSPAKETPAQRGRVVFLQYCAACHGVLGKGDGPAAQALKTPPTNLSRLAANNGGHFPEMKVLQSIKAGSRTPAHGSESMPVWGPIFLQLGHATSEGDVQVRTPPGIAAGNDQQTQPVTEREVQLRIYNLMEYIQSLQGK